MKINKINSLVLFLILLSLFTFAAGEEVTTNVAMQTELCLGVDYQIGVMHQNNQQVEITDLKGGVALYPKGVLKVAEFGIAQLGKGDTATVPTTVTPQFLSNNASITGNPQSMYQDGVLNEQIKVIGNPKAFTVVDCVNHKDVSINEAGFGKVEYLQDIETNGNIETLKNRFTIVKDSISINSKLYPEMNKPAKLTFYNCQYNNPVVVHDGIIDTSITVTKIGNECSFNVNGFSEWSLTQNNWQGQFFGTDLNNYTGLVTAHDSVLDVNYSMLAVGGGIKDMSYYFTNASIVGATFNGTHNPPNHEGGSYYFDGGDHSNIIWGNHLDMANKSFTVAFDAEIHDKDAETIQSIISVGTPGTTGGWLVYQQDNNATHYKLGMNHLKDGDYDNGVSSAIPYNGFAHFQIQYNYTGEAVRVCVDDVCEAWSTSNTGILGPDTTAIFNVARRTSGSQRNANMSFEGLKLWDRLLSDSELTEEYNEQKLFRFQAEGQYLTVLENTSDYDPLIEENVWFNMTINPYTSPLSTGAMTVYGRSGTCATVESQAWTLATQSTPGFFTWSSGLQGKCFQANITLRTDGTNYTHVLENYTLDSQKYLMPEVRNLSISGGDNTSVDILGNSTFFLNDTNTGQLYFEWYINNILSFSEAYSNANDSSSTSTLTSSNFFVGDVVYFKVTPENGLVNGTTKTSSNLTVGNANYNFTFDPSTNATLEVKKPTSRKFTITFTQDIDNDAIVSWYADGTLKATGDSYKFKSGEYEDYQQVTLIANITDGEFNNSVEWTVDVLPADIQAVSSIAIVLFILFVAGGLFALPFKKDLTTSPFSNMILRRGCWAIAIYLMMLNASIMATIAASSGLDLTGEMFRYMWLFGTAGWIFLGFFVLKTILDLTKLWKVDKTNKRMGEDY